LQILINHLKFAKPHNGHSLFEMLKYLFSLIQTYHKS